MHNYIIPNRYKFSTRVGNWSEEWELEEVKMKDYLKTKSSSQLASTIRDTKQTFSLRQASISYPNDGYLHFDYHIMLANLKTNGFLACDIQERVKTEEEAYAVSTTNIVNYPSVRTVFVLQQWNKEPNHYKDNIIRYGQKFRIIANPRISNKKTFWLHSLPIQPSRCAKISRQYEVCVSSNDCFNTVWTIQHSDPKVRFEMDGQPVGIQDSILIQHCFTQQWLASDEIIYQNDFGKEREVFCHSFQCLNKTQNLIAEKEGRTTIDIPLRNQQTQNLWKIIVAKNKNECFDESQVDDNTSVNSLLNRIRQQIQPKGIYAVRGLSKIFIEMDEKNSQMVSYDDFKWALRNYTIQLTEDETKTLFYSFDSQKIGQINFNEFLGAFRTRPNEQRLNLISSAYTQIIQQSNGKVTLDLIGKLIQVQKHPDVIKGYKTEREVFKDFVKNWNKGSADREITFDEFYEYYMDISSVIERDEIFEAQIKNVWRI